MKQLLLKKGQIFVEDIPVPGISDYTVLVKVHYSCISAGTEMLSLSESGKSLIKKAVEQPDKVKKVIEMVKKQGVNTVFNKIKKLDSYSPIGYSDAGIIIGVGKNITDLKVGDRVACAGAGFANHSEIIEIPRNLVMKLPKDLSFDLASTVTLGGIAMQGARRADLRLGEFAAVIGMGILGQLEVQILKVSGCKVIGIDIDNRRLKIAKECGCDYIINSSEEDVVKKVEMFTEGYGVDSAIITAASKSNDILSTAFNICKRKGKVVLVGVVGKEFNREDMYDKELDLVISTSYGPGRYDNNYEEKGLDYPYSYVRWTENRNMQEYLLLLSERKINLEPLIEKVFNMKQAAKAYETLKNLENRPLVILLKYEKEEKEISRKVITNGGFIKKEGLINVAIVGAGSFAKEMHLPNLKKLSDIYNIYAIMSRNGINAKNTALEYGAKYAATDYEEILKDSEVDMVMICTRHNLHAAMAIKALKSGKAVFVEKPMALSFEELEEVLRTIEETNLPYMVGFNRRFSKYAVEAKKHIENRINPMIINYQMNAGYIKLDNWVHSEEGGGRIIGEGCHIFDLFNYLTGSEASSVSVDRITPNTSNISQRDNVVATVKYKDGSICTLTYTALGNNRTSKELCQIYCDGNIIIIDDYKKLNSYGISAEDIKSNVPDKGQYEELIEFSKAIKSGSNYPVSLKELSETARLSFLIDRG